MKSLVIFALLGALPAAAQPPELVLKSTSRVVQLEVFVNDASGHPVHGLKKDDFAITDNGRPREIRIFSGEVDANDAAPLPELTALPPGVYSNRFGLDDARIVTALAIDAVLRPEGLQQEPGRFANRLPEGALKMALGQARGALNQMAPGEAMAIYAACPDLRVVQDFTSDPEQLRASLEGFTATFSRIVRFGEGFVECDYAICRSGDRRGVERERNAQFIRRWRRDTGVDPHFVRVDISQNSLRTEEADYQSAAGFQPAPQ
jgi:VWFA-related protein